MKKINLGASTVQNTTNFNGTKTTTGQKVTMSTSAKDGYQGDGESDEGANASFFNSAGTIQTIAAIAS